jgi:hypothetical protein
MIEGKMFKMNESNESCDKNQIDYEQYQKAKSHQIPQRWYAAFFNRSIEIKTTNEQWKGDAQRAALLLTQIVSKSSQEEDYPINIEIKTNGNLPCVWLQLNSEKKVIFDDLYACKTMSENERERFRELEGLWGDYCKDEKFITEFCTDLQKSLNNFFDSGVNVHRL